MLDASNYGAADAIHLNPVQHCRRVRWPTNEEPVTVQRWKVVLSARGSTAEISAMLASANVDHLEADVFRAGWAIHITVTVAESSAAAAEAYAVQTLGRILDRPLVTILCQPIGDAPPSPRPPAPRTAAKQPKGFLPKWAVVLYVFGVETEVRATLPDDEFDSVVVRDASDGLVFITAVLTELDAEQAEKRAKGAVELALRRSAMVQSVTRVR